MLQRAIATDPKNPLFHYKYAVALEEHGEKDRSKVELQDAQRLLDELSADASSRSVPRNAMKDGVYYDQLGNAFPVKDLANTIARTKTDRLVSRLNELRLGNTQVDVIAKLGPPTTRFTAGPNKSSDPAKNSEFFRYVVRQKDSSALYDSDQYVEVRFDPMGKLTQVRPHNVEGVRPIP